jgi:hypothetical protein
MVTLTGIASETREQPKEENVRSLVARLADRLPNWGQKEGWLVGGGLVIGRSRAWPVLVWWGWLHVVPNT